MSEPRPTPIASDPTASRARRTVRAGAKALVTSSQRVLLVNERHADGTDYWTLPGGGVGGTESPPAALRRELAEELRCQAVVGDPVDTAWYCHTSLCDTASVYAVFDCALLSEPDPARDEGVLDLRWARPGDLPPRTLPLVRFLLEKC